MKESYKVYQNNMEQLQKLEKRYCSLMKQAFNAGIKDRSYSNELNEMAINIKKEIDQLRSQLLIS